MIETLQAENADLKKNLGLAGSKQNEVKDQQISSKFEELLSRQSKHNVTSSCNTFMYMYAKYCNILTLPTLTTLTPSPPSPPSPPSHSSLQGEHISGGARHRNSGAQDKGSRN